MPFWYIFSIALISRLYCQVPQTKAAVRENMVQVLIMSLFKVFHGHTLISYLKMKHKPHLYFPLHLFIEYIPHPLSVFHWDFPPCFIEN